MRRRARWGTRSAKGGRLVVLCFAAVLIIAVYELYALIVPDKSANPLWREVTIGQNVIGDWKYGGQDEEGYLRFYNKSETVVLPPTARLFDADGQFVVIEKYTPSSLTYALPYAAIPMPWLLGLLAAFSAAVALLYARWRRRPRRMRLTRSSAGFPVSFTAKPARRFRPTVRRGRTRRPWR
ncbi:MAG: hypothetical protein IRZ10_07065 [Thermoflavifilum sp.]|nr:hypothetical protein [Thermoflavifilum sp.]MCL6514168.1 hypothetical protein [Alicyclobacillus sp.]